MKLTVYTDGSCERKSRNGGYGIYIIKENKEETHISKGYSNTTISRMEMRAVLNAIRYFPKNEKGELIIYSDSQFVVNSFNLGWLNSWRMQSFAERQNSDIWKKIIFELEERKEMKFTIHHTRGHLKDLTDDIVYGNSVADILASYKNFEVFEKDL